MERVSTPSNIDEVCVVWADSSQVALRTAALDALGQRETLAARRPGDPARFITSRMLIADLLAELAPAGDHELSTVCVFCGELHGAVRALHVPIALSVSYAGTYVVVAAVHHSVAARIGVDVEQTDRPDEPLDELAPLFAPAPPPSARGWTRIEAVIKADGRGAQLAPHDVRIEGDVASVPGNTVSIEVSDVVGPPGCVVSLALLPPRRR